MFMKNNKNTTGVHQISGFRRLATVQTADGGGAAATVEVSYGGAGRKLARFAAVVVRRCWKRDLKQHVKIPSSYKMRRNNICDLAMFMHL
ncbi:hypothetical protein P8452_28223 [Trifolium repens]|nr:hypothetical protein P8452_28223 [Trifolium repens]